LSKAVVSADKSVLQGQCKTMTKIMGCPRCPLYLSDSPVEPF